MTVLNRLDWTSVRRQYDLRVAAHRDLIAAHERETPDRFARLALGVDRKEMNYSAHENHLGPKILAENPNASSRVQALATILRRLVRGQDVPQRIREAGIKCLAVGVGSELGCVMNPERCWVTNTRTIWADLLIKHSDDFNRADMELALYREQLGNSEMAYAVWTDRHLELDVAMTRLATEGRTRAAAAGIEPGPLKYLWADAIANTLFDDYAARR